MLRFQDLLKATYPQAPVIPVVDKYPGGQEVTDRFRWLEDSKSAETVKWVAEQNKLTTATLEKIPAKEGIKTRLTELFSTGSVGLPSTHGEKSFYFKRDGGQNQSVLMMRDAAGAERPVLDPNTWSQDGTEALDWHYVSQDGKYVAYGRSSGGDEWSTLRILDTDTGQHLGDEIPRTRACSLAWLPDESGFYYTKYPAAGEVPPGQENYHRSVFFHPLGGDPKADELVLSSPDAQAWPNVLVSKDGKHALLSVSHGWSSNDLILMNRETGARQTLVEGGKGKFNAALVDGKLLIHTDENAPRYKLMVADLANPAKENWKELIPQHESAVLEGYDVAGGKLFATVLQDASHRLVQYSAEGVRESEVALPGLGSLGGLSGQDDGSLFYSYSSYNQPSTVYKRDVATGNTEVFTQVEVPGVNPADYDVKQEWFDSFDGTRVPMFVIHKKGLELDGHNPTLLYGYGGFDVNMLPGFSRSAMPFLEDGGVYVVANLRGGGEFGSAWHEGGMLDDKQNVFDDFITAGQTLIERGYTCPEKLACSGGSNGGLLVGAAVTQRPEMFKAAICAVPLLDMLRYDQFGIAKIWIPEYGSAQNPHQFDYIKNYSPYQNVKEGVSYPAMMFMSGAEDSRTDPLHARKMVAELQKCTSSDEPILLRVEEKAGHGAGKPLAKIIESETEKWSFLYDRLGVKG